MDRSATPGTSNMQVGIAYQGSHGLSGRVSMTKINYATRPARFVCYHPKIDPRRVAFKNIGNPAPSTLCTSIVRLITGSTAESQNSLLLRSHAAYPWKRTNWEGREAVIARQAFGG